MNFLGGTLPIPKILVVGDLMLDIFRLGEVHRVSPEAPIPVLVETEIQYRLGGAANVAVNIAALGGAPLLVSCVGDDWAAGQIEELLNEHGIRHLLLRSANRTSLKTRYIGQAWHPLLRVDSPRQSNPTGLLELAQIASALNVWELGIEQIDALVISDYDHGSMSSNFVRDLIGFANQRGIPTIVDPKPRNAIKYQGATILKPNLSEAMTIASGFENGTGNDSIDEDDLPRALSMALDVSNAVVSLGARGVICYSRDSDKTFTIASPRVQQVDPTGAGDTLLAGLALGIARGDTLNQSALLGTRAAASVVAMPGTSSVPIAQLKTGLRSPNICPKILINKQSLISFVESNRAENRMLVVTNGVFDMLHSGHIHLLRAANRFGDRLIVLVNSDESTRRLKGDSRPINSLEQRMEVLSSLEFVDAVYAFAEDTPLEAIKLIRPDVLVKGGDYQASSVVGFTEMHSWGGEVQIVDRIGKHSTTATLHEILSRRISTDAHHPIMNEP